MFKLSHKKVLTISAIAATVTLAGCFGNTGTADESAKKANSGMKTKYVATHTYDASATDTNLTKLTKGKKVVDGGVYYPVVDGKRGPYYVNETAHTTAFNKGREALPAEIAAWDVDVMYNGPFPEGHGTVGEGEEIYEEKCVACHGDFGSGAANVGIYPALSKGNAYELHETLKNQRINPDDDGPVRVFGSYWPYASTAWWYIKTGMPHPHPKSLEDNEVYALVAYMLSINELRVAGEVVEDEDFELNQDNFGKIEMPNKDGFIPELNGPNGVENIRALMNNPHEYGARTLEDGKEEGYINGRCMTNCLDKVELARITIEQKNFLPPLSEERSLPKEENAGAQAKAKEVYEASCAMCHDSGAADAPIIGNKAQWAKYLKEGMETVYKKGIEGVGAMPAKGGTTLSDAEFKSVVDYIVSKSK